MKINQTNNKKKSVSSSNEKVLSVGDVSINLASMEVKYKQKQVYLSPQESQMLILFLENPNKIISREQVLERIWGKVVKVETRVVDVYVGYLRKKINGDLFRSVRGKGYVFKL